MAVVVRGAGNCAGWELRGLGTVESPSHSSPSSHTHSPPRVSDKNSKVNAIIMFCIGGAILLAMLVLMAVVICLYYKVANALNMPKVPVCLALKNNPAVITPDKVSAALTAGPYPSLQCCDECNLYPGFDALPPCCCNVNEGL
ncbi:protein FAM24A-like [Muntiacus reevesi]|uniref:protein FAM24A-like n=1 Tax=Muntiacus reevesi TaxID=9886 RepID=UPI0033075858